MKTNIVLSRARRIFRSLDCYSEAQVGDIERLGVVGVLQEDEQLVGIYTNPDSSSEIYITTERACIVSAGVLRDQIWYRDIRVNETGDEGKCTRVIHAIRHDGTVCSLPVQGGKGQFRDSMAFLRFLERVMIDCQGSQHAGG